MPESSTELEELRRRVEEQSQRIDELQDALHTLSIAVRYREEEPYLAFLAEHGIAGLRRVALMMAIAGVLSRAQGEVLPLGSGACDELLPWIRAWLGRGLNPVSDLLVHLPKDCEEEILLACELMVERALGQSQSIHDVAQTHRGVALSGEALPSLGDERRLGRLALSPTSSGHASSDH